MPSAAIRTTWARCTKRWGWLLAFAQDCRVARSSGDKTTAGARLLMGKSIRERAQYVKLFMTHYTSLYDDLPPIDQRRFVPERHLQAHALCCFDDGLDRRLYDSAARQFHKDEIADFIVTHLSDAQMGVLFDVPETFREHKLYSPYLS